MKQKNLIEENQKLKKDIEYFKEKYREIRKENLDLRKEIEILKKNLDNF